MPKTFIDLFAGIGGFHWALAELDYECLLAVEKDEAAQRVYKKNFPGTKLESDIRLITRQEANDEQTTRSTDQIQSYLENKFKIKKGKVGIICGGFPCQPFSKSGEQQGAKDATRGTLFHDILLLTGALQPDYLILENVRNLAGPKHRETLKTIIQRIKQLGYEIDECPIVLSPHQLDEKYGSPQVRERVFILAHRKNLKNAVHPLDIRRTVDKAKKANQPKWRAESVLEKENPRKYEINEQEQSWIETWEEFLKLTQSEKLPGFPIWTDEFKEPERKLNGEPKWKRDFIQKNRAFYRQITQTKSQKRAIDTWLKKIKGFPASRRKFEWQANSAFQWQPTGEEQRTLKKLLIQFRPSGIRVKPATHYPALVAITQTTIVGPQVGNRNCNYFRYITPKEAAKLQGMPKIDFAGQSDGLSYKQLGNAVNVGVVRYLAERLTGAVPCEAHQLEFL
jgi:DNA (cytosine-5)-methyltransferase 1